MVDKETVLDGYDQIAAVYNEQRSPTDVERRALASFFDKLPPESRVLDAGCGGGKPILRTLTRQSHQAIGLDFSRQQLTLAQSNAPDAALLRGDMARLPLANRTVDAAIASHSLIHIPAVEHQTVLTEFARVLRPSGRLLVTEGPDQWCGTNPDWLDTGTEMQWHIAGAEATREQLMTAGFQIDAEHRIPESLADGEEASWLLFEATCAKK